MTERERLEFNMERAKDPAVQTEHYGGPSSNKKPRMMGLGGKNLLQIYMERLERHVAVSAPILSSISREANKKHVEFGGEISARLPGLCDPAFYMAMFDIRN